jgi:hypothetical protein
VEKTNVTKVTKTEPFIGKTFTKNNSLQGDIQEWTKCTKIKSLFR